MIPSEGSVRGEPSEQDLSMPRADQTSVGRWMVETALLLIVAFVIAQGVKAFVVQPFVIPTGSMIPTIGVGDYVLAEKDQLPLRGHAHKRATSSSSMIRWMSTRS